jgi:hypothetical protein
VAGTTGGFPGVKACPDASTLSQIYCFRQPKEYLGMHDSRVPAASARLVARLAITGLVAWTGGAHAQVRQAWDWNRPTVSLPRPLPKRAS